MLAIFRGSGDFGHGQMLGNAGQAAPHSGLSDLSARITIRPRTLVFAAGYFGLGG